MKKQDISSLLRLIPDIDHPYFNSLRHSLENKVSIPVTLYLNGEKKLHAEVKMFGHAVSLYVPALAMVLEDLKDRQEDMAWDEVSFTNPDKKWPKEGLVEQSSLAVYMQQYRKMDFNAAMDDAYASLKRISDRNLSAVEFKKILDEGALKISAVILVSSIEIDAAGLKNNPKGNILSRTLKRFKP